MKIGLAYDLKEKLGTTGVQSVCPDDISKYDSPETVESF